MRLEILDKAEDDLVEGFKFYEAQQGGLGAYFLESLYSDIIRAGRKLPARDSFPAATALHHGLTIATRNEKDFAGTGVKTVNPWL